uniref:Protein quiver n=1 Tax=Panagrellus redivivus TaxID=6233 RepID=A0A7E4VSQ9_PANRE
MSRCLIALTVLALVASTLAADAVKAAETVKKPAAAPAPAAAAPAPAAAAPAPAKVGTGAVPAAGGVKCYQCNSANVGQEDCEKTEPEALAKFIKPCPAIPKGTSLVGNNKAAVCRKIELVLKDEHPRIVRECAYTSEIVDGKKRTGSKGIRSYFYTCENTDAATPCNPASTAATSLGALLTVVAAMVVRA